MGNETFYWDGLNAVYSFIKVLIYMIETISDRLGELKNKVKLYLGNPKSGRGCL